MDELKPGDEFSFDGKFITNPDPSVPLTVNAIVTEIKEDGTIIFEPSTEDDRMKLAYAVSVGGIDG